MSLLNVSIYDQFGMISTDSMAVTPSSDEFDKILNDPAVRIPHLIFSETEGRKPIVPTDSFKVSKIFAVPHMQAIVAFNGCGHLNNAIGAILPTVPCTDIKDFENIITPNICAVAEQLPPSLSSVGVMLGWSASKNRILGWHFSEEDGFKPHAVTDVMSQPQFRKDDKEFEVHELGQSIDQEKSFHLSLCNNQYKDYMQGRYREWFHCDNAFQIAYVSQHQISFYTK